MIARRAATAFGPLIVVAAAAASAAFDAGSQLFPVDLSILGAAADTLWSPGWRSTFASPAIQVGPLHLLLLGALRALARGLDLAHRSVFSVVIQAMVAAALMATVSRVTEGRSRLVAAGAGAAGIIGGLGWVAYISGHPEELFIGLLWVWAGTSARAERGGMAGALLGIGVALKLTGILGLPLLLFLRTRRERVRALCTTAALCVVAYGPFLMFGDVHTFDYRWPVDNALWRLVLEPGDGFPWTMRALQGGVVIAAGAIAVRWLGRTTAAIWSTVAIIAVVRILFDPQPHHYLWLPFEAAAVVGASWIVARSDLARSLAAGVCAYGIMVARYLAVLPGWAVRVLLGAALVALARSRADDDELDPTPSDRLGPGGDQLVEPRPS